jgi:hypothetical protein
MRKQETPMPDLRLYPTPTRLALLADVDAGHVIDDADCAPHLHHDEGASRVAAAVWELRAADWVQQTRDDGVWELTPLGRDVLNGDGHG